MASDRPKARKVTPKRRTPATLPAAVKRTATVASRVASAAAPAKPAATSAQRTVAAAAKPAAKAAKPAAGVQHAREAAAVPAPTPKTRPVVAGNGNGAASTPPVGKPAAIPAAAAEGAARASSGHAGFDKAVKFLDTLNNYEGLRIVRYNPENFDLSRMRNLLRKMDNPQDRIRTVHIAGTKGKGSTTAMTAAMLEAQGLRVGTYTSPHLVDLRERIAINGQMISHEDFAKLVRHVEPIIKKLKPIPTWFDVVTAIAFQYFADQKVDIAIIETGLGGRLDSTNVIKPEVSAITSISMDHMQQLGHTVAKIAGEKAGIFKPGVPAITVGQVPEVEAVLKRVAGEVGAPLDVCGGSIDFSYRFEASRMGGRQYRVCLTTNQSKFEHITVPLFGEHQALNCGLAMAIIDRLKSRGIQIDDQKAMDGLAKAAISGRMEIIREIPKIMVDAAHNAASVDALMRAIGQHVPYDSLVVIFGCCGDKDIEGMLGRIAGGADKVIFTKVNSIRSANPHELAMRYTESYGKMAQVTENLQQALSIAYRAVTKEDLICITGSFYLAGEAKRMIQGDKPPAPQPQVIAAM
jgi:dihydrofolate synthase/folylpolyglutamate synthase